MKRALLFVLGFAMLPASIAVAQNGYKITGGGQVVGSSDGGAGDTIAFTAQDTSDGARGQLQVIDRSEGGGRDQVRFHGSVTCIQPGPTPNSGQFGGVGRTSEGDERFFTVSVMDNGEGGNDGIIFQDDVERPCDEPDADGRVDGEFARGNLKIHPGS